MFKKSLAILSAFIFFILLPSSVLAAELQVPSQYSTIQAAIDASQDEDVINVAVGTYNEVINFNGKSISVIGESKETTIIDGTGLNNSVVTLSWDGDSGEYPNLYNVGPNQTLENLTIRGGYAVNGGGILIRRTSPSLKNLIIRNNFSLYRGGGIYIESSGFMIADGLLIEQNESGQGGALSSLASTPTIRNTVISNNNARGAAAVESTGSGGIYENITIKDHTMVGDVVLFQYGNAPESNAANAPAIRFENSRIINNTSTGSLLIRIQAQFVDIKNAEISHNQSAAPAIIHFISDGWYKSILNMDNVTIAANSAVRGDHERSASIWNESGDNSIDQGSINIKNSIFWNNLVDFELIPFGIPFDLYDPNIPVAQNVSYSILTGGYSMAEGILNIDPLFVDVLNGDYHLTSASPAIDSGDPNSPLDPDGTRADMGAYPFFHIPSPTQQLDNLISLVQSFNLQQGIENSLDTKLQNAYDSLSAENAGDRQDAINKLQAFISAVQAQSGNKLTVNQANTLIQSAQSIISQLTS